MKYAEFCAGIGGFTLGIQKSKLNGNLVYINEINTSCEKTFKTNYGRGFDSHDLFDIDVKKLPDFDMICAGFPCQPFSIAGKQKGFFDDRGTIFFKLLDIVIEKQPKVLFFENVPNLTHHDCGKTYRFIKNSLENEGYSIFDAVLDSSYFGVPQSRPRIYIVGFRNELVNSREFRFTEQITEKTPLREYINAGDYSIPISDKWQYYIDLYTNRITADDIPFSLPKTRKALERQSVNCDLNDCVFQIRSSGIRAYSLDEPFPTFAVSNSGGGAMIPVLSKERRHLSLLEMTRIMGFPDSFNLSAVSRTDAIKELANAVCPPVITSICEATFIGVE